jgi:hypothetical protein
MRTTTLLAMLAVVACIGCDAKVASPTATSGDSSSPTAINIADAIVGTWQDSGTETTETYTSDGTVISRLDETISVPISEAGFTGTATMHVAASTTGQWTLNDDQFSVTFTEIDDLLVDNFILKQDENLFGVDLDLSAIAKELQTQFQHDLPAMLAGQTTTLTILSITGDKLVTQDEDGETEEQIRIATQASNGG